MTTNEALVILAVTPPAIRLSDGRATVTSQQVADHFGKRHDNVLRAIRNMGMSEDFTRLNFEGAKFLDDQGKPRPMYHITRDGFAMLAMGFTGKEAMKWKEAYINAFNAMERKLRALYVEPLLSDKQFRMGIPMRFKFKLQEQSQQVMEQLVRSNDTHQRRNLYWQLRQVNDALGIPTDSPEVLGIDLPAIEGGAA